MAWEGSASPDVLINISGLYSKHHEASEKSRMAIYRVVMGAPGRLLNINPAGTWRNDNVIMTPNEVATSFLRHNDVIIASRVRWEAAFWPVKGTPL